MLHPLSECVSVPELGSPSNFNLSMRLKGHKAKKQALLIWTLGLSAIKAKVNQG